jgi:hypothetical protein
VTVVGAECGLQPLESAIAQKLEEEELTISDLLTQADITLKVNC